MHKNPTPIWQHDTIVYTEKKLLQRTQEVLKKSLMLLCEYPLYLSGIRFFI